MSSIIVFNDLHLADNPPAARRDTYREEGLAMLKQIVWLANQMGEGCEAVVCTGDLFHVKRPDRTSHNLVGEVVDILRDLRCGPLVVAPGNHDLGAGGIDGIWKQPLGVLGQARVAVWEGMTTKHFSIWTVPYNEKLDCDPEYYRPRGMSVEWDSGVQRLVVLAAHGSIVPDGVEREFPVLPASAILGDDSEVDVLACGHIHEDLGVHRYGDKVYLNVGALGRTARTKANMTRTVKIAVVGHDRSVTELPLTTALTADLAFLETAPVVETEESDIADFVRAMAESTEFEQMDLRDYVRQVCREAGVGPEIETRLLSYVEE